jgi:hypothetical protein
MPGQLYYKGQQIITPTLGGENALAMYLGTTSVSYDSRFPTFISASGGTIFDSGSFRYHLFTSSADFTVHSLPLSQLNSRIEVLVVGGGGGGAPGGTVGSVGGGNGGAVVYIPNSANYRLNVGTYNISVGAGGIAGVDSTPDTIPTSGSRSYISGSGVEITALGGASTSTTYVSQSSLSGVSGQYGHNFPAGLGGQRGSGGGGGAGEPGFDASAIACAGGAGGDGYLVEDFPFANDWESLSNNKWGAGGGGTSYPLGSQGCGVTYSGAPGGESGGGYGKSSTGPLNPNAINGYPNTGGGGGANIGFTAAGAGGSGFVGIRYQFQA